MTMHYIAMQLFHNASSLKHSRHTSDEISAGLPVRTNLAVELCIINSTARLKAQELEQSLVIFLFSHESQAVKQHSEVIVVHQAISVSVHQPECCENILRENDKAAILLFLVTYFVYIENRDES